MNKSTEQSYTAPEVREIGTLEELTQDLNKVGKKPDIYSNVVPIVGSIIPV